LPAARAEPAAALERLDAITRRLRRECPWDREQDERSIVPHTVEEAYELADAAHAGDDEKLLDELGDVLFQVYFLALLLEERGAGDLAAVADHCREKLIRRHPHVFGEAEAESAGAVLERWDEIKRTQERGGEIFGELPETLPAALYARKLLRRAAGASQAEPPEGAEAPEVCAAAGRLRSLPTDDSTRDERFAATGDLLFGAIAAARDAGIDPELALRARANQFRAEVEATND